MITCKYNIYVFAGHSNNLLTNRALQWSRMALNGLGCKPIIISSLSILVMFRVAFVSRSMCCLLFLSSFSKPLFCLFMCKVFFLWIFILTVHIIFRIRSHIISESVVVWIIEPYRHNWTFLFPYQYVSNSFKSTFNLAKKTGGKFSISKCCIYADLVCLHTPIKWNGWQEEIHIELIYQIGTTRFCGKYSPLRTIDIDVT